MNFLKYIWRKLFPNRTIKCDCESCSKPIEEEPKPKQPTEHELKLKYCDEHKIPDDYVLTNLDLMRIYQYLHHLQCIHNIDGIVGYVPGISMSLMNKIGVILERTKVNV